MHHFPETIRRIQTAGWKPAGRTGWKPVFLVATFALCAAASGQIPIGLGPPSLSGGAAQLQVSAANDTWFTLQSSADLTKWQPLATQQVQLSDRAMISARRLRRRCGSRPPPPTSPPAPRSQFQAC